MCFIKHIFITIFFILIFFVLIFGHMSSFMILEIFLKNNASFWIYLWVSSFFSFDNFTIYLIYEFLLWNVNLEYNTYLSFFSKKITKKYLFFAFDSNFTSLLTSIRLEAVIPCFFFFLCYVIFTNAKVESICIWIFTGIRVRNITSRPSIT